MKFINGVLIIVSSIFFFSCEMNTEGFPQRFLLIEDTLDSWDETNSPQTLMPNDAIHGDSVLSTFKRGLLIETRANSEYSLVIQYDGTDLPDLNLFLWESDIISTQARVIHGQIQGDLIEYQWSENKNQPQLYVGVLSSGESHLKSKISSVKYTGYGSDVNSLGINLHFVGVDSRFTSVQARKNFANQVKSEIANLYQQGGLSLTEVKVVNGKSHPKYGDLLESMVDVYFDYIDWSIQSESSSLPVDSMSSGMSAPSNKNLDVVVVPYIDGRGIVGIAPFSGGSLLKGWKSVVVVAVSTKDIIMEENSDSIIVNTLAHEIGHFLGLRHTSSTSADLLGSSDNSIVHDGISDTPFEASCQNSLGKIIAVNKTCTSQYIYTGGRPSEYKISKLSMANPGCPDDDNLMFPKLVLGVEQNVFTVMQGEVAKSTIGLLNP